MKDQNIKIKIREQLKLQYLTRIEDQKEVWEEAKRIGRLIGKRLL